LGFLSQDVAAEFRWLFGGFGHSVFGHSSFECVFGRFVRRGLVHGIGSWR